jgi:outer membrane protein assembly factor BamA
MRALHATPLALFVFSCATLCPTAASARQLSDRLERCLPSPTFAQEVADVRAARDARRLTVDGITFDGPTHMPDTEREALLQRLKATPTADDDGGIQQQEYEIENWWKNNGYFLAEFKIEAAPTARDDAYQHVILKVHVDEGAQYRMGTISFRSADPEEPLVFSEHQLTDLVQLRPGDVFGALPIRATLDALLHLYGSHGYIDFVATPITEIDESTHRVNVTMELDQQKPYRIRNVTVHAASAKVRAAVNEQLKPGDVFDSSVIPKLLKQNATLLPPDVSARDVWLQRDTKLAVVNLQFELEPCPQAAPD